MQPETATLPPVSAENPRQKFLIAALNSTAIYVLAYYGVWAAHEGSKVAMSRLLHIRGLWDPSRIVYTLADREWWQLAVLGVYGIGPLVCFFIGVAAFWWYWKRERAQPGLFKLLLLWVAFHACNAIFGALLADSLRQEGSWYVTDWLLRMGNAADVVVALVAGLIQLGLGHLGSVAFLQAHDSHTVMKFANRKRMVLNTLMWPWMGGGVFIGLTKLPYFSMHEALHLLMMGLLIFPLILGCVNDPFDSTVKRAQPSHTAWGLVLLAVLSAVVWRLALSPPVPIQ
ncbi:hypothetical protein MUN81_11580 [Hymenobacter sp. 5317J-9]|uniref:hypothetical protein n=1 Tax=Hymenobacter sp. 5317J-9 TaxID=2932250 RepID=UPI001FD642E4|nr:hypothetical protein [Hymenobacter sp. 5317J-9]UOQ95904.1 hypothetical protein MUN81_11580 [Hymenobacter sp. 5317J-9]